MKEIFNWLTVISGIITAGLWYYSSIVKETIPNRPNDNITRVLVSGLVLHGNINVGATLQLQSKWNTRAAIMSAITAVIQALTAFIPSTSH
jgi:hypothetical protein